MKTCFRRKDLKMTKRVNRRLFHTALAFAAVCALTVPSMTIRADKTAEAGEGTQTALAAVQEETPGTEQPQDTAAVTLTAVPEEDSESFVLQLQSIRDIQQTQLEQVQTQIRTLTQLQETAVIDAAQLQLLGQLQTLEQVQLEQIAQTDTQLQAFADLMTAEEELAEGPEIIFVGDSRFVQMHNAVGGSDYVWIAKSSQGYKWFASEAVPQIDAVVGRGTKILINLGVNDVANVNAYAELVNKKAAEWTQKGATVYYASVNPVENGQYITKSMVNTFNKKLQARLSPQIHWIDSFSYLQGTGYTLTDGLHYSKGTSKTLYKYYLSALGRV